MDKKIPSVWVVADGICSRSLLEGLRYRREIDRPLWGRFFYDGKNFPLKFFGAVKYLFGAGLHPKCLFNTPLARRILSKIAARKNGKSFDALKVPFEKLKYFNYCEVSDPVAALKEKAKKRTKDFFAFDGDAESALSAAKRGADFVFLKCGAEEAEKFISGLEGIDCELSVVCESERDFLAENVDSALKAEGLKFGRDCVWFLGSSTARFWYIGDGSRERARRALEKLRGKFLDGKSHAADDVFVLDDGYGIEPSFVGGKNCPVLFSNREIPPAFQLLDLIEAD